VTYVGWRFVAVLLLAGGASACRQAAPPAAVAPSAAESLAALTASVASGAVTVVDLAQPLNASTPIIQLPPPFANTPGFSKTEISNFDARGPAWYWNAIALGEHVGTHFDAPCHWISGRDKVCVDTAPVRDFIGPAAVIDVTAEVASNADFVLTKDAILKWEQANGRIPARAWVILRTGWGARATDAAAFLNVGADKAPHYPGFGLESAQFLTTERDVLGVGTEAIGTDAAVGAAAQPPFPNHFTMHGAGKYGLTQLANVASLPATGAVVIATPLKLDRGSGSPVRVIALVPSSGAATRSGV
jgi:kynurenine formamidase